MTTPEQIVAKVMEAAMSGRAEYTCGHEHVYGGCLGAERVLDLRRAVAQAVVEAIEEINQRWREGSTAKDEIDFAIGTWRALTEQQEVR